jgi:hypothetical protein
MPAMLAMPAMLWSAPHNDNAHQLAHCGFDEHPNAAPC